MMFQQQTSFFDSNTLKIMNNLTYEQNYYFFFFKKIYEQNSGKEKSCKKSPPVRY